MAARNKKIKWTNKFSGECGFVKALVKSAGHFENTFDFGEAKLYSDAEATRAMKTLSEIGETENNVFEVVFA